MICNEYNANNYINLYNLSLQKQKFENCIVSSVYWIPILDPSLKSKQQQIKFLQKFPWFEHLTLIPTRNPLICNSSAGKPISVWYSHPVKTNLLGVPRYFGLSAFGLPDRDIRNEGQHFSSDITFQGTLKDLQVNIVNETIAQLESPWHGATIIADCGIGKTAMALYISVHFKRKIAIVCPGEILIDQWKESIQKFCKRIVSNTNVSSVTKASEATKATKASEASENVTAMPTISKLQGTDTFDKARKEYLAPSSQADIMLCSIDTLATGNVPREILSPYGFLIVDEMHHLAASSLVHIVPMFPAKWTLGLTATPKRSDGLEYALYWLMGPVSSIYQRIPEITGLRETVDINYTPFKDGLQKEIVYYNGTLGFSSMIRELTEDPTRNKFLKTILSWCLLHRKRIIAVTAMVAHAHELGKMFENESVAIMAGPTVQRDLAKEAKLVLATYSLLEEGYDDPSLDTLVLLTPRSNIQQTIGRIERDCPGKMKPLVIDIVDTFSLFPNMYYKRKKFYSTRGFRITSEFQFHE